MCRNERIPEMVCVGLYIVWAVKTVPVGYDALCGLPLISSNGGKRAGGRNRLSSAGARSYMFHTSFCAIPVVGPSIVGLTNSPEHLQVSVSVIDSFIVCILSNEDNFGS